ncbi:MAG TPA: hypothetical protein VIF61_03160 [Methylocystis sp.]
MSNAYYSVIEPASARRQFRLSIAIVVGMAVGALILGFATQINQAPKATALDDGAAFNGRLVSFAE